MTALERLYNAAVVPVVVLDDAADAVPTAKALLAGGVDVMEITFRTAAAADSITAVAKECPDMLVGAGTVITLEQCKKAVACGAKFIVAPGYSDEVVSWCVENNVAITPGCVTPTEIMAAMSHGLKVVKFFPANVYGGLSAMKALSGPFGGIKFIPTGGVNDKNLAEYISAPFIHAVGGSWLCAKADIAAHNFDKITSLCKEARKTALGFEIAHVGVNADDAEESLAVCRALDAAFGFGVKEGNSSNFAGERRRGHEEPLSGQKRPHCRPHQFASPPRSGGAGQERLHASIASTAKYKGREDGRGLSQGRNSAALPSTCCRSKGGTITMKFLTFGEIMLRLKAPGQERFFQSPDAGGHLRRWRGERGRLPGQLRRWTQHS